MKNYEQTPLRDGACSALGSTAVTHSESMCVSQTVTSPLCFTSRFGAEAASASYSDRGNGPGLKKNTRERDTRSSARGSASASDSDRSADVTRENMS